MEFKPDNFDKEFSLNNNKKKNNKYRGKIPSWLMILAGIAVIGGVVAARQPAIHPTDNNIRNATNNILTQTAVIDTAAFSPFNDQKVDPMELEAHFLTQDNANFQYVLSSVSGGNLQGFDMEMDPLSVDENGAIIPPAEESSDTSVFWVDGKPYALTIQPREAEKTEQNEEAASAYYMLNDQAYEVHIEPVSETEIAAMSDSELGSLIQIGGQTYMLQMNPVSVETELQKAASEEPTPSENLLLPYAGINQNTGTDTGKTIEEKPAVAWLGDKAYAVTVKPQGETSGQTVLNDESNPNQEKESQTSVFTAEGKTYELQLTELKPEETPSNTTEQPVVWLEDTPLQVVLHAEPTAEDSENAAESDQPVNVSLQPLTAEQTSALQKERFGQDYLNAPTEIPEPEPTVLPTDTPAAAQEENNWFVNMFTGIFGSSPTQEPTAEPQVTVIPLTPTPTIALPTATSIVIRMQPTAAVQGPVRLDGENETASESKTVEQKAGDLEDPALWDESESAEVSQSSPVNEPVQEPVKEPEKPEPVRIQPVVVDEFETQQPTTEPTPEELPHTGMAEGWNIPSLLGMLAGLLLVIIGVRRLRSRN